MAKNTTFALGEHFDGFIQQQVDAGHYGSANEVVRDALRVMEAGLKRRAAFDAAIEAGMNDVAAGRVHSHEQVWAGLDAKRNARRAK